MEQTDKKKKNISALIGIIAGAATLILVQQLLFKSPTRDRVMMQVASEINKSCPIMVDDETRLDNAVALPGNTFQYHYTLVNKEKETTAINQLKTYLKPNIINDVKTNPDMKIFRDDRTTLGYYYKDKNGVFLFDIVVSPDLYTE